MSHNREAGATVPEAGPALPSWARPLSAVEGHPALLLTGTIVFSLCLVYLADVLTPPFTSVGAAAIIPVLAATWFLSRAVAWRSRFRITSRCLLNFNLPGCGRSGLQTA